MMVATPRLTPRFFAALLCLALAAPPGSRAQPNPDRLARQIRIMEKVIDQVLVESQHALVTGHPNCRGLRLAGYGVLFAVDLSPITGSGGLIHFNFKDDGSYELILDDEDDADRQRSEGRRRVVGRRDSPEEADTAAVVEDEDGEEAEQAREKKRRDKERKLAKWVMELEKEAERGAGRQPERDAALDKVLEELTGALRDYGRTLTGIGPDEHVAIAIFPSDLDWRGPHTRILLQVKQRTIDAYDDGKLTAEQFTKQVEVVTQ